MPHFHLKKLTWNKDFRISIVRGQFIISIWTECSVCGYKKEFISVECSNNPEWVMVY